MKWDSQTVTVVCSIVLAFCALGVIIQTGHADINSDIRELRTQINGVEIGLRAEIGNVESRLRTQIEDVDSRLRTQIEDVDSRLRTQIEDVDSRLRTQAISVDDRLDSVDRRLTRIEVHLFGIEPESEETP